MSFFVCETTPDKNVEKTVKNYSSRFLYSWLSKSNGLTVCIKGSIGSYFTKDNFRRYPVSSKTVKKTFPSLMYLNVQIRVLKTISLTYSTSMCKFLFMADNDEKYLLRFVRKSTLGKCQKVLIITTYLYIQNFKPSRLLVWLLQQKSQ